MDQAKALADNFHIFHCPEQLEAVWKRVKPVFSHWDELVASCRTATNELKRAVDARNGTTAKKGQAKAKGKSKSKAKGKPTTMYQLVEVIPEDCTRISRYDSNTVPEDHDMSHPCILTQLPALLQHIVKQDQGNSDAALVLTELNDFEKKFQESDLRFTTGKGQRAFKQDVGAKVSEAMLTVAGKHHVVPLQQWQPSGAFCCVESHRSVQYEVGGLPSLRFCVKGTRALNLAE